MVKNGYQIYTPSSFYISTQIKDIPNGRGFVDGIGLMGACREEGKSPRQSYPTSPGS